MNILTIYRASNNYALFDHVWHARSISERLRGLIGRGALLPGQGMLISPCNSVHTLFMGYELDIIYMDKHRKVLKKLYSIPPSRFSVCIGAYYTLELPKGESRKINLHEQLDWNMKI